MKIRKTLKYRLYHNRRNKRLIQQIDIAGIIWNHLTALQRRYYRMFGGYIPKYRMMKHIAKLRNGSRCEWKLLGSQAVQQIVERHDMAYQRFFEWAKNKRGRRVSPPRFRKVKQYRSFTLKQAGWKYLGGNRLRIGKMVYKFALSRPIEGEIKTVTIKRDTVGRLFVCFSVVQEVEPTEVSTNKIGGFDFGLKHFLTDDEGRRYQSPEFLRSQLNEIARLNRALARKQKGSNNREKARRRLAMAHSRLANKRRDHHFKLANRLLTEYDVLCFEDLNIEAMKRLWGRKVSDLGFAEFLKILEAKANEYQKTLVKIGRFEASSKTCSSCGSKNDSLSLKDRLFQCPHCGLEVDRDHNAALNIRSWGINSWARGSKTDSSASLV